MLAKVTLTFWLITHRLYGTITKVIYFQDITQYTSRFMMMNTTLVIYFCEIITFNQAGPEMILECVCVCMRVPRAHARVCVRESVFQYL